MNPIRIKALAWHVALAREAKGQRVDEAFLLEEDARCRELAAAFPNQTNWASLEGEEPPLKPWEEVEVEVVSAGIRRILPPFEQNVAERLAAISSIVADAVRTQIEDVHNIIELMARWMRQGTVVRIVGAGRALLAASLPANRLAHGGANVSILGDRAPLPNSRLGGAVIAASASGATPVVLDIMAHANRVNEARKVQGLGEIVVVGISNRTTEKAKAFRSSCTPGCFLGIQPEPYIQDLKLRALGDIEECSIVELLDALIVAAGLKIGRNFYLGHEDMVGGGSGPWHQYWR